MTARIHVAGVPIDPLTLEDAIKAANLLMKDGRQHFAVTPNPEMALLADRDKEFAKVLDKADLAVCDGFGLALAARLYKERVPEVVTGTDLAFGLAWLCAKRGYKLYLLGGEGETAKAAGKHLTNQFPGLVIGGAESGGLIERQKGKWRQDGRIVQRINDSGAQVLFVALGHGKQEKWIHDHLQRLPLVRLAIGIGGAFDYWSGAVPRAPRVMRVIHLEWLWRLFRQPSRIKRIFDAVVRFPMLALKLRPKGVD